MTGTTRDAGGPSAASSGPIRVQKLLAAAGLGSRRACEELIAEGRVAVDGRPIRLGGRADPARQVVTVDGERVPTDPSLVYWMLNKPPGVVTTASDPEGRPTVTELVPAEPRVFPVGRLDADSEGLLVLTNDGELAHRLTHPSYEVTKTYVARVRGPVKRGALRRLETGVALADGPAKASRAREIGASGDRALVEIVLTEGRKREVRRMLGEVGLYVERLARTEIGPVRLEELSQGKYRPLRSSEVRELMAAAGMGGHRDDVAVPGDTDAGASVGMSEQEEP